MPKDGSLVCKWIHMWIDWAQRLGTYGPFGLPTTQLPREHAAVAWQFFGHLGHRSFKYSCGLGPKRHHSWRCLHVPCWCFRQHKKDVPSCSWLSNSLPHRLPKRHEHPICRGAGEVSLAFKLLTIHDEHKGLWIRSHLRTAQQLHVLSLAMTNSFEKDWAY